MNVAQMVMDTADAYGVPPALALELAIRESKLNPNARGAAGEVGVMQLMPATAASLGVDPYNVAENIKGGVLYLSQQLQRFGDTARALAAYNCGPKCVGDASAKYGGEWLRGVPASTRQYVSEIMGNLQTAWQVAAPPVFTSLPTPSQIVQAMPAMDWKRIAVLAGIGLLVYFSVQAVNEA